MKIIKPNFNEFYLAIDWYQCLGIKLDENFARSLNVGDSLMLCDVDEDNNEIEIPYWMIEFHQFGKIYDISNIKCLSDITVKISEKIFSGNGITFHITKENIEEIHPILLGMVDEIENNKK